MALWASRGRLGDTWYLDEVLIKIRGELHYLWCAIDQDGGTIDILVQKRRNKAAEPMFRGSELQVTVAAGGVGKILDFGLIGDIRCPDGFAPGDIESVLVEFGKQLDATSAAIDKYMSETPNEELAASELPEGWIPFSDQDIQDLVEIPCDVIPLRRGDQNE